jgi:hypothetical protein
VNAKRIAFSVVFVLTSTGCAASMAAASPPEARAEAAPSPAPAGMPEPAVKMASVAARPVGAKTSATPGADKQVKAESPDVLVVYTGDVAMTVDDGKVASTIDRTIDVSDSLGGHLAGRRDQTVTVRVPSPRFHEALEKITALGEVTHQSVSAEDVSEEFHDAEVRLENLKATQKRLQEFLARSANMKDMLTLEHELERVSMEIDRIEGRMRFLRDHAAFSTLSVALAARPKTQPLVATPVKPPPPAPRILPLHAGWLDELGVQTLVSN